jgi:hypothetical protein
VRGDRSGLNERKAAAPAEKKELVGYGIRLSRHRTRVHRPLHRGQLCHPVLERWMSGRELRKDVEQVPVGHKVMSERKGRGRW